MPQVYRSQKDEKFCGKPMITLKKQIREEERKKERNFMSWSRHQKERKTGITHQELDGINLGHEIESGSSSSSNGSGTESSSSDDTEADDDAVLKKKRMERIRNIEDLEDEE